MRMKAAKEFLKGNKGNNSCRLKLTCMDPLIPNEQRNGSETLRSIVTPACVDDGYVDLCKLGEGIVPANQHNPQIQARFDE